MNRALASLTLRQLLGKRRALLMVLFGLLPVVLAVIFRFAVDTEVSGNPATGFYTNVQEWTAKVLLANLIVGSLLPIVALSFATTALGSEFEEGTAPYLLGKPIPRWRILLWKVLIAWAVAAVLVLLVVLAASGAVLIGQPTEVAAAGGLWSVGNGYDLIAGFAVASVLGTLVYTALFVLLSVVTSRAFIVGLIYVFLWEGVVTRLFTGTRVFSVRQYTLGIADGFADMNSNVFDAPLGAGLALTLLAVVTALAAWLGVRRLERWEIGEAS